MSTCAWRVALCMAGAPVRAAAAAVMAQLAFLLLRSVHQLLVMITVSCEWCMHTFDTLQRFLSNLQV